VRVVAAEQRDKLITVSVGRDGDAARPGNELQIGDRQPAVPVRRHRPGHWDGNKARTHMMARVGAARSDVTREQILVGVLPAPMLRWGHRARTSVSPRPEIRGVHRRPERLPTRRLRRHQRLRTVPGEVLADPTDEEYEHYWEWVGGIFDPELFDLAAVNAMLQRVH
jgi:hypothetical protein